MAVPHQAGSSAGHRWGCLTALFLAVPLVGLTFLGLIADQCGDPGVDDCERASWWWLLVAVGIALAAGLGVRLAICAIGGIRRALAVWRGDIL